MKRVLLLLCTITLGVCGMAHDEQEADGPSFTAGSKAYLGVGEDKYIIVTILETPSNGQIKYVIRAPKVLPNGTASPIVSETLRVCAIALRKKLPDQEEQA